MAVRFTPMLVIDPTTGLPLTQVRGEQGTVVEEGTDTALTLTEDEAGTIPMANPVSVTEHGFTPQFWVQEEVTRADLVSGSWRSPLVSFSSVEEKVEQARQAAVAAAADVAAQLANLAAAVTAAQSAAQSAEQVLADAQQALGAAASSREIHRYWDPVEQEWPQPWPELVDGQVLVLHSEFHPDATDPNVTPGELPVGSATWRAHPDVEVQP